MWLYVSGKDEKIDKWTLGKSYNVEYELGNGKTMTFNNTLENIDDKYYWFLSEESGLDVIKKIELLQWSVSLVKQVGRNEGMLKLKQYFCKHEFYLVARNKLVSEEMYHCWKCDVYEVRYTGILTRFKTKRL